MVDKTYYLPFGEYRRGDSSILTESGFTGHLHNDSLGLIYMNARFYSPSSGRFITADTIIPDPQNPQSYNRYSYTYNNPLRFTDPSGHFTEEAIYDYLYGVYGNRAYEVFGQWKSDNEWWEMLRLAQAGDVLFASVGERELDGYYHFLGEGQEVLSGIAGSLGASRISDDFGYISPSSLNELFSGNNNTIWGGLFIKDEKGQVVDVFHRASVTNIYEADDHMSTSPVETVVREGASSVLPEAMCSVVSGFAAGVGCESVMGGMFGIVAPDVMVGPDYVISPLDVSPGDLIYVSAGHVFRYKAGLPSMDVNRHYNRLDMYYYGSVSIFPHYHLIVRYQ